MPVSTIDPKMKIRVCLPKPPTFTFKDYIYDLLKECGFTLEKKTGKKDSNVSYYEGCFKLVLVWGEGTLSMFHQNSSQAFMGEFGWTENSDFKQLGDTILGSIREVWATHYAQA